MLKKLKKINVINNNKILNNNKMEITESLDDLLNVAIYNSFRTNVLNLYNNRNINRSTFVQSNLSTRYYNTPPIGGYQVNEEHEYTFDYDDINALIFLDITTRFASPVTDIELKNIRKKKIKQIKYHKVKKETTLHECPICLEEINTGEYEKKLNCNHCFHKKCIDRWFNKENDCCPMCRLKVIN